MTEAAREDVVADDVATPEPSLRETLELARDAVVDRDQEAGTAAGPGRDASGRFTKRETDEAGATGRPDPSSAKPGKAAGKPAVTPDSGARQPQPAAAQPATGGGVQASPAPAGGPAGGQPAVAPQGWTPAAKELWTQIPEAARAEIARREADFHRTITAHDQVRSVGNEFMKVSNEFGPLIAARGNNPVNLWREYLGILQMIERQDPVTRAQTMRDLAMRMGADPRALGSPAQVPGANGAQPSPQAIHPAVQQMVQEWRQFQQSTAEAQRRQAWEAQQREQAELATANGEIEAFRSLPGHDHFDAVSGLMTSLLRDGHAQTLEDAYKLACQAHPQVSATIAQAEAAKAEAARQAEIKKRQAAEAARRKAGSVRGGAGGAGESAPGSKGSVRADLEAAFAESRARV